MILSELRDYLKSKDRVALYDIAIHFNTDAEAIRGMLEIWEKRGKVRKLPAGTRCDGGCTQCAPASLEVYQWCGM